LKSQIYIDEKREITVKCAVQSSLYITTKYKMSNPWTLPPNSSDPEIIFYARVFHYRPSLEAAIVCTVAFAVMTFMSLVLTCKYGGRFMYIVPATGLMEMIGFMVRIVLITAKEKTLMQYIMSALFILISPIALGLVNFIVVSKLLTVTGKPVRMLGRWIVQPHRIARTFFLVDLASFFLQGGGVGLQFTALPDLGLAIVIIGLVMQLIFVFAFIWILHQISTDPSFGLSQVHSLKKVFLGLRLTVAMLLIRTLYRVIEYVTGFAGPIATREWTFYNFDTWPILLALLAYCVFHFGKLLECNGVRPAWIVEYEELQMQLKETPPPRRESGETPFETV
jgi:hypothetical protein